MLPCLLSLALSFAPSADPVDPPAALAGEDFRRRYPARFEFDPDLLRENGWTSGPDDVWSLSSFRFSVGRKLEVECGPCTVVFGVRGTDVLWAALYPETDESSLKGKDVAESSFRSLYLRFHPEVVGALFPKKTVEGPGDPLRLLDARNLFAWKINNAMQVNNTPHVAGEELVMIDADLTSGRRSMLFVDGKQVKHETAFANRSEPLPTPLDSDQALAAFDAAWTAFDSTYAMFGLEPEVDWDAQREAWRPLAERADSVERTAAAIACCIEPLDDLHTSVTHGDRWVAMSRRERQRNASFKAVESTVGSFDRSTRNLIWGRIDDIGVVIVDGLSNGSLAAGFDAALEQLDDTTGLVLDLRFNGGGDELLAREIAGRFLAERALYSRNRYRGGSGRDELGDWKDRYVEPRGPWRYRAPVVVLQGPKTMSSAESFLWMLRSSPDVITMGAPTAGASANPTMVDVGHGIRVRVPRWLDGGPDGSVFEKRGIAPDEEIEAELEDFDDQSDPVFEAAIEHLEKLPRKRRVRAREE